MDPVSTESIAQGSEEIVEKPNQNSETPIECTLKIRILEGNDLVSILFTPQMTCDDLSKCILHVLYYPDRIAAPRKGPLQDCYEEEFQTNISGLFRERDDIFVPLSYILLHPNFTASDTFRISRQLQSSKVAQVQYITMVDKLKLLAKSFSYRNIISLVFLFMCTPAIVKCLWDIDVVIIWATTWIEAIMAVILRAPVHILERCIDHPLKELYRYGPSLLGWEGLPLSQICLQITHMADESFWRRNMDECLRIYQAKEKASLQIRKPLAYLVTVYLLFLVLRLLLQTWALRYRRRDIDPDMVETYQAFHILMRQIRKGMKVTSRGERHED